MKFFRIHDGRAAFWQWDLDRKLIVDDFCKEVHFCNGTGDCSLVCEVYEEDGQLLVNVPNLLLQTSKAITVYAFVKADTGGFTRRAMLFPVHPRTKPEDYVYTETEVKRWEELDARLQELEQRPVVAEIDWSQNDPDGPGYVKNRTHWAEGNTVELLPECQPTYSEDEQTFFLATAPAVVVGETYTINWNGTEYKCVCQDGSAVQAGMVGLGNANALFPEMGFISNDEPFAIASMNGMAVIVPLDGTTRLTISIYQVGEVVHKLDNKYIDAEWMATSKRTEAVLYDGEIDLPTSKNKHFTSPLFTITEGETYKVEWDGVAYECIGYSKRITEGDASATIRYLGNALLGIGGADTGEPFCYVWVSYDTSDTGDIVAVVSGTDDATHTFKVSSYEYEPVKIPEKFLPDNLGGVQTVNGIAPDESGNVQIEFKGEGGGSSLGMENLLDFEVTEEVAALNLNMDADMIAKIREAATVLIQYFVPDAKETIEGGTRTTLTFKMFGGGNIWGTFLGATTIGDVIGNTQYQTVGCGAIWCDFPKHFCEKDTAFIRQSGHFIGVGVKLANGTPGGAIRYLYEYNTAVLNVTTGNAAVTIHPGTKIAVYVA